MSSRSDYSIVEHNEHNIVFIVDQNLNRMSVTNDAENVFLEVQAQFTGSPRVVYRDSQGEWWEMKPHDHPWDGLDIVFEKWHGHTWDALKGNV